jgi:hypothetical protein
MAKFMYVFRGGGYAGPAVLSPAEVQAHLAKWNEWSESLRASGRLASAQPLSHPPTGKTVRGREKLVTDGPYAESKDLVSGILVVEAASLDEAAELARGCPILELDGSVEVRPVLDVRREMT